MEENTYALPSALDSINRQDFSSDAAYYEAAANLEIKRSTPEFQKAYTKIVREAMAQREKEIVRENKEMVQAELKKTWLTEREESEISQRVQEEVAGDIRSGKINAAQMSTEIDRRAAAAVEAARLHKAKATVFNQAMRDAFGRRS